MPVLQPDYTYHVTLIKVVDGDTLTLEVDLGFRTRMVQKFRLYGINAPEVVGDTRPAGLAATAHISQLLGPPGTQLTVNSYKDPIDKYGRWLVTVYDAAGNDVNRQMVKDGFAVNYLFDGVSESVSS
jgi:micrococcal nuclease